MSDERVYVGKIPRSIALAHSGPNTVTKPSMNEIRNVG